MTKPLATGMTMTTKRTMTKVSSGVEQMLREASLYDQFMQGGMKLVQRLETTDGIQESDFDAVGTSEIGVVFLKEVDPSGDYGVNDRLLALRTDRWELMKSRKELAVDVLISRGSLKTKDGLQQPKRE